jgi:signal transduction histidine kinase
MVQGREDLLRQLLANLLGNIARHTSSTDAVRVRLVGAVEGSKAMVKLTIEDGGPGLPEVAYESEMDAFKRFDPSRSRENGGSGLGMSIIAGIVRSHLGSLKLSKSELGGLRTEIVLKRVS